MPWEPRRVEKGRAVDRDIVVQPDISQAAPGKVYQLPCHLILPTDSLFHFSFNHHLTVLYFHLLFLLARTSSSYHFIVRQGPSLLKQRSFLARIRYSWPTASSSFQALLIPWVAVVLIAIWLYQTCTSICRVHPSFQEITWLISACNTGNCFPPNVLSSQQATYHIWSELCAVGYQRLEYIRILLSNTCLPTYLENNQEKRDDTIKMTIRDSPSSRDGMKPEDASASLQHPNYRPFETLEPVCILSSVCTCTILTVLRMLFSPALSPRTGLWCTLTDLETSEKCQICLHLFSIPVRETHSHSHRVFCPMGRILYLLRILPTVPVTGVVLRVQDDQSGEGLDFARSHWMLRLLKLMKTRKIRFL